MPLEEATRFIFKYYQPRNQVSRNTVWPADTKPNHSNYFQ